MSETPQTYGCCDHCCLIVALGTWGGTSAPPCPKCGQPLTLPPPWPS